MGTYFKFIVYSLIIFSYNVQTGFAQDFGFTSARKSKTISFKLVNNLIIIPLYIEGKGPFNFVLDTGVGICLITEPSLADSLGKKSARTITMDGVGEGGKLSAFIYPNTGIQITKTIVGFTPVAILKEDPFNLSSFVGMPIHGLIGYDLFNSFIIGINYPARAITFYNSRNVRIARKGSPVPIILEDRKPYVKASVRLPDGVEDDVRLLIDTGSGHPVSLETKNNAPYNVPEKSITANLGVGLSGIVSGHLGRLPAFYLGKFKLKDVICAFPSYSSLASKISSINRNGSLGNSALMRFHVVFDYRSLMMHLKPNHLFKEAFEHDMAGMEIVTGGSNYDHIFVSRVEKGSPAETTGIKADDKILSVNFRPAAQWTIEELHNLFRSKEDKRILLEVQSPESPSRMVLLILKKRI